jgi:hypothetical protein
MSQGVGCTTRAPFPKTKPATSSLAMLAKYGFDALSPIHLPLPRAVGPYSVIRVTKRFLTSDKVLIFGTTTTADGLANAEPVWATGICVSSVDSTLAMNAAANCNMHSYSEGSMGVGLTLTPAAFTVQVMNPNALQTTAGIVYAGRIASQLPLANTTRTWDAFADTLIAYHNPRLMSAGKLALRGVRANAIPFDMSDLSDFRPYEPFPNSAFTWNGVSTTGTILTGGTQFQGFGPLYVVNTGTSLELEYLVTIEFRARFDPGNFASSAHSLHPPAPPAVWDRAISAAHSAGVAFEDIAEKIADAGIDVAAGAAVVALAG